MPELMRASVGLPWIGRRGGGDRSVALNKPMPVPHFTQPLDFSSRHVDAALIAGRNRAMRKPGTQGEQQRAR